MVVEEVFAGTGDGDRSIDRKRRLELQLNVHFAEGASSSYHQNSTHNHRVRNNIGHHYSAVGGQSVLAAAAGPISYFLICKFTAGDVSF